MSRPGRSGIHLAGLLLLGVASGSLRSADQVAVDADVVLKSLSAHPTGINLNYLMDDDALLRPAVGLSQALGQTGVKFLRYPGGEKADSLIWSESPWTAAAPSLARSGPAEWPSNDSRFTNGDGSLRDETLDFDEFMSVCQSLDCEPLLVVAYDSMYGALTEGGIRPTREELLDAAENWVWYANVLMGYDVKYWMIGNESWIDHPNGQADAATYRDDVIEFATRMRSVDPTIKIVINGRESSWWQTVLPSTAYLIDYLAVTNYPIWNWPEGYERYRTTDPDFMWVVWNATEGIDAFAPQPHRDRLRVIATEVGSKDWTSQWPAVNDLGHALLTFDILGHHMVWERAEAALLWSTRWVDLAENPHNINHTFDAHGGCNPTARALGIWGTFTLDEMVLAEGSAMIRPYATHEPSTGRMNIFLINKDTVERPVDVNLNGFGGGSIWRHWELRGSGPGDFDPSWGLAGPDSVLSGSQISLTLPAVSITVLELGAPTTPTDSDGDSVDDFSDCAPADAQLWSAPGEVGWLDLSWDFTQPPSRFRLAWQDLRAATGPTTRFDVVTGSLDALRSDQDFSSASCLAADLAADELLFDTSGDRWYLIRARSGCGDGTFGSSEGAANLRGILDAGSPACP